ncbi:hypothetical protein ES705_27546 [subsurface metagenome]|uniref:Uncharacterized protein n=1 Tax=marine sediment metagenome TaxID=412755 RepID=X1HNK4_9ZZZZ
MANRILDSIARIEEKLKTVPPEKVESLSRTLKTDLTELIAYQNLQAAAFACGKLTEDEAMSLYRLYGGELPLPEKFDKLSLAEKIVATQTAAELAKMNICNIL